LAAGGNAAGDRRLLCGIQLNGQRSLITDSCMRGGNLDGSDCDDCF